MQSKRTPDLEDFLAGMVTTPEDNAALEQVRSLDHLGPGEYLRFLMAFTERHPPTRQIPLRHEPFVL